VGLFWARNEPHFLVFELGAKAISYSCCWACCFHMKDYYINNNTERKREKGNGKTENEKRETTRNNACRTDRHSFRKQTNFLARRRRVPQLDVSHMLNQHSYICLLWPALFRSPKSSNVDTSFPWMCYILSGWSAYYQSCCDATKCSRIFFYDWT
jgi:hypothetical protein